MKDSDPEKPDFYKQFMKPVIMRLDPEVAHALAIWALEHDLVPPPKPSPYSVIPHARLEWKIRWAIRFLNLLVGAALRCALVLTLSIVWDGLTRSLKH